MPDWEEIRRILVRAAASNGSPDPEGAAQDVIIRLLESKLEPSVSIEMYFYVAGRNESRNQLRRGKIRREREVSLSQMFRGLSYNRILSYPLADIERRMDLKDQFNRFLEILSSTKTWHRGGRSGVRAATIEDLVLVIEYINTDGRPSATDRARVRRSRIRLRRAWKLASQGDSVAGRANPSRRPN